MIDCTGEGGRGAQAFGPVEMGDWHLTGEGEGGGNFFLLEKKSSVPPSSEDILSLFFFIPRV